MPSKDFLSGDVGQRLTHKQKLERLKHWITHGIAISVILVYVLYFIVGLFQNDALSMPEPLQTVALIIIGFYFGRGVKNGD